MKAIYLKEVLKDRASFLNKAVLIDGPWGIGKTYYVKQWLKKEPHIYTSLFGINSLEDLQKDIYYKLDKTTSIIKNIAESFSGANIGLPIVSIPIPTMNFDIKKSIEKCLKDKCLTVVIDDVERKNNKIDVDEVLGFVETLSEIDNINVILICNLDEINSESVSKEKWQKFEEKVISRTFKIEEIANESIEGIVNRRITRSNKIIGSKKYIELSEKFIKAHNIKNLRLLEYTIDFSDRLIKDLNITLNDDEKEEIFTACFATVTERKTRLYMQQEERNDNKRYASINAIYSKDYNCILKNYFNGDHVFGNKVELIKAVLDIYDCVSADIALSGIKGYFKNNRKKKRECVDNVFYGSIETIKKDTNEFIEDNVKNESKKDCIQWFRDLSEFYSIYVNVIGSFPLRDNEIYKAMDSGIKSIDTEQKLNNLMTRLSLMQGEDPHTKKLLDTYKQKASNYYYEKKISNLEKSLKSGSYDANELSDLMIAMNQIKVQDIKSYNNLLKKIINNNFFLPDLNKEINDSKWSYVHSVWKYMEFNASIEEREAFCKIINKQLSKANKLGKYRLEILMKQYRIQGL